MDETTYRRAREVFDEVIDLPPGERDTAIHAACGDDAGLLTLVRRLVSFDTQAGLLDVDEDAGVSRVVAESVRIEVMPTTMGAFEVVRELGRGGMGVVYEARQDTPRRRVALKTLIPFARSAEAMALFRTEVDALARVLHPGIPQVYEVFEHDGVPTMAMEFVDGVPLLHAVFLLDLPHRARMLADIADAVEHAHRRGVIHRDIKPQNVLVTADGQPKVLDFGIARLDGSYKPGIGTLVYMAPDQLDSAPPDAAADVYALGAMAFEMITGSPPFAEAASSASVLRLVKREIPPLPDDTPPGLVREIHRAMAVQPEDRHPTADAFAEALRAWADAPDEAVPEVPKMAPSPRLPWVWLALAAGVGLALSAWWWR